MTTPSLSVSPPKEGKIHAFFRRLRQGQNEREAEDLLNDHPHKEECMRIDCCTPGEKVTIQGTVRSITIHPKSSLPALELDLYDGTGSVTVIFMGRRHIPGISAGRFLTVTGRLTCNFDKPSIYNPKYELHPSSEGY